MITPLAHRQMFQTINAEAVRAALEVSGQFQRELAQRQSMADRVAEDQHSVPEVPTAEELRAEERQGRQQDSPRDGRGEGGGEDPAQDQLPAKSADGHLDFLI